MVLSSDIASLIDSTLSCCACEHVVVMVGTNEISVADDVKSSRWWRPARTCVSFTRSLSLVHSDHTAVTSASPHAKGSSKANMDCSETTLSTLLAGPDSASLN